MLDSSVAQLLSIQIQLDTKVSNLQDELEQISIHIEKDVQEKKELKMIADDLDERKTIKRENLELDVKECEENVDRVYARQNTMEEQMNERTEIIGEKLDKLYNLQQLLASQITRIETIVKESEKEKETLVNDVQSLCSQIQDNISKTKERIDALETKSEILQEVQKDVDILKIKSECIEAEIKKQDEDHIPKNIRDSIIVTSRGDMCIDDLVIRWTNLPTRASYVF
ncbi:ribonuclease Y-like [Mytilus californianus]|uniref:ribonuclease Y-like n=1 Tax=Mytilus californianus TaxID=6549 RepID=UPI0022466C76|nr:ribonuclease Y-like [Mytilus californianus]